MTVLRHQRIRVQTLSQRSQNSISPAWQLSNKNKAYFSVRIALQDVNICKVDYTKASGIEGKLYPY